jgi:hypothetical protein
LPRRIEAHFKLCILALQLQRATEIRCAQPWARIAHELAALKAIRCRVRGRAIVQRTKIPESLGEILKNLRISMPYVLQLEAEQNPGQIFTGDDDKAVRLLQVGTDLAEKDVGREADGAGEALADLLAESPLDLEGQFPRGRHLALGAHEPTSHDSRCRAGDWPAPG